LSRLGVTIEDSELASRSVAVHVSVPFVVVCQPQSSEMGLKLSTPLEVLALPSALRLALLLLIWLTMAFAGVITSNKGPRA